MLHKFLSVVFSIAFFEFIFMYVEFDFYNDVGKRSTAFLVVNIAMSVARNTMARVMTLLVALGYGIRVSSVAKHIERISLLAFAYAVSATAYLIVLYLNRHSPVSESFSIIVSIPISITNIIFVYWTISSLSTTVSAFKER